MDLRIISGGQTGVDRGALDAAIEAHIPHGGTCPRGRRAEDGPIPAHYQLKEAASEAYPPRTAMNVQRGHGTLLLVYGKAGFQNSRGTKLTLDICKKQKKPWHAADPRRPDHAARVAAWIDELARGIEPPPGWLVGLEREKELIINVAGPRESRAPGIQEETRKFLMTVFPHLREIAMHSQVSV